MTASERAIFDRLRVAYPKGEWALLPQVPDGTGMNKRRTADAIAMQLWPSRGLVLHGFEFKAHRGDWRKELQSPEKAESIAAYCHYWWIVAPKGIVPINELPHAWGLIEISEKGQLRRPKQAPLQQTVKALDYPFLAGLLRAVQEYEVPDAHLQERYQQGRKEGVEEEKARKDRTHERYVEDAKRLRESVQKFEAETGLHIDTWRPPDDLIRAVKLAMKGNAGAAERQLERLAGQAEQIAKSIRESLEVPA
jgi:hypothetical protein